MQFFFSLVPLIPLFPLLAFAAIVLFTYRNNRLSSNVAIGAIVLSTLVGWGVVLATILTLIYSVLLIRIRKLFLFAYAQMGIDVISAILLIYVTGGVESWLSFTLVLIILASSIVLNKKAGFVIATMSSISYGILVNLQFYGMLPIRSEGLVKEQGYLYKLFVHIVFFYLTAYLSGYLSSRLEKTVEELERTDLDLRNLELFNKEVIESLPSGLFTVDMSGVVLLFNHAAERITGMKRDLVIGRKIDGVMPFFQFPFSEGRREEIIPVTGWRRNSMHGTCV